MSESESKQIEKASRNPITAIVEPRTSELVQVFMGDPQKAERFKGQAATLAVLNQELSQCDPASVWLSLKGVAELDLQLTPALGQAYILPYNCNVGTREEPKWVKKAQLIVGYKGLKEIAYRSGIVRRLEAVLIRDGDLFRERRGTNPGIDHEPAPFGKRGKIIGAYATATLANGEHVFEVMEVSEIDAIKNRSKNKKTWESDYAEMARKTPVRRLAKYLPTTPLLARALELDDDTIDDAPRVETPARRTLAQTLAERHGPPAADAREPEPIDTTDYGDMLEGAAPNQKEVA